ncbi:MAG: class I SAM-dependent methyltransferase [Candidatus Peribacteraceae bacterium]|nr:class I SAM-dependent methyltransferase [Candidatus Peribacteraceae bacterium]
MMHFIRRLGNTLSLSRAFPYAGIRGKGRLLQLLFLYASPRKSFPRMSIVPLVRSVYNLPTDEAFFERYAVATQGFEELWQSKPRATKGDIEHFYQEHDKDIWRQAYLSCRQAEYKKKILKAYHALLAAGINRNASVLDYGGGAGVLVHYLAAKGFAAVDIADIPSQTLTFVHRTLSSSLRSIIAVDGNEDFGQQSYTAIVSLDCLEHTMEPLAIIKRLIAALRPGGLFVLNFPKETDFSTTHTRAAQVERDRVFAYLHEHCHCLCPFYAYRKRLYP